MRSGAEEIMGSADVWYNAGVRVHNWEVSAAARGKSQFTVSPRAQFALKPDWEADMVFRI
jgi:hypothetical protein